MRMARSPLERCLFIIKNCTGARRALPSFKPAVLLTYSTTIETRFTPILRNILNPHTGDHSTSSLPAPLPPSHQWWLHPRPAPSPASPGSPSSQESVQDQSTATGPGTVRGLRRASLRCFYISTLPSCGKVAYPHVRANAAFILLDAFPLQDPDATREQTNDVLQKQFDTMMVGLGGV